MSSEIAIKVDNLCKCYQIYDKPRDRLLQMLMRGHRQYYREFWALKDVSFEIKKGETLGIIGRNGCGKSTLLQMICGTLNPTSGDVQTNGRIAALLELGSGFNPEFTGRENIFMNAAVLGLSKEEIESRFEDIVAFADIGSFIEQPVKTYSSGMSVRLAFAVAINVNPQILVVDEALAVGDELFQRKCFSRIEQIKEGGATILFVSHSGATIVSLCDRAILLDSGEKISEGLPKHIVGNYQKMLYAPDEKRAQIKKEMRSYEQKTPPLDDSKPEAIKEEVWESFDPYLKPSNTIHYESYGVVIGQPIILTLDGQQVNNLVHGRSYCYQYTVTFNADVSAVRFGMLIKTIAGIELGGAMTAPSLASSIPFVQSGSCYKIAFQFNANLTTGTYFMNAGVLGQIGEKEGYLDRLIDGAMFRILPDPNRYATAIIDFGCIPEVNLIS
ncbi:MAG: ABC transporter ATP-binding protein [Desulfocapsaceae bacterium]|jgi:lipopolysaccharide transport system ATP-binding protein|nr:ABC transporter ATP-binding protein [Desulfocapsaceae bacterium]